MTLSTIEYHIDASLTLKAVTPAGPSSQNSWLLYRPKIQYSNQNLKNKSVVLDNVGYRTVHFVLLTDRFIMKLSAKLQYCNL